MEPFHRILVQYVMTGNEILGAMDLTGAPKCVLIVEDQLYWLERLTRILEAHGHRVIQMIGVLAIEGGCIEGIAPDGTLFEDSPEIAGIEAVFLDYNFVGGKFNGASFMRRFRLHSEAPVLGMSSVSSANAVLASLGANIVVQKDSLKYLLKAESQTI